MTDTPSLREVIERLENLQGQMDADILGPRPRQIPKSWHDCLRETVIPALREIEAAATSPAPTLQRYMISSETRRALETAIETCRGFARPGGPVSGRTWDKYEGAALRLEALLGRTEASPAPLMPAQREAIAAGEELLAWRGEPRDGQEPLAAAQDRKHAAMLRSMLREGEPRE